jgi:hypothetical protein
LGFVLGFVAGGFVNIPYTSSLVPLPSPKNQRGVAA